MTTETIPRPADEVVCYHEAGHAVVSMLLGRKVLFVDADSGEANGIPHHGLTCNPPLKMNRIPAKKLTDEAQIALAGPVAEAKAMGEVGRGAEGDGAKASAIFGTILSVPEIRAEYGIPLEDVPDATQALLELYTGKTRELIEEHWNAVTRVANALSLERSIAGPRLRQLVKHD